MPTTLCQSCYNRVCNLEIQQVTNYKEDEQIQIVMIIIIIFFWVRIGEVKAINLCSAIGSRTKSESSIFLSVFTSKLER